MVLWTRLTGAAPAPSASRCAGKSPPTRPSAHRRARRGDRRGRLGAQRPRRAAGLEPGRWYWYRFRALGAAERRSAARAPRRPPTPQATLRFVIASCQRFDVGHYAAWRHVAAENLDLVLFLGDYIYEYASRHERGAPRSKARRRAHARPSTAPATPPTRATRRCRRRTRAAPWLMVWDDHEVAQRLRRPAGPGPRARLRARGAPPPTRPTGSTCRSRSRRARAAPTCASSAASTGARWRASTCSTTASTATRRPARSRPRRLEHGRARRLPGAARPEAHAARRSSRSAGSPTAGTWRGPGTCSRQQTLMARFAWSDPATGGGGLLDRRLGRLRAGAQSPARRRRASARCRGVVVLGGDVHSNYVADLKADFDDPRSPVVASEFCGTSITSLSLAAVADRRGARLQPARPLRRAATSAAT